MGTRAPQAVDKRRALPSKAMLDALYHANMNAQDGQGGYLVYIGGGLWSNFSREDWRSLCPKQKQWSSNVSTVRGMIQRGYVEVIKERKLVQITPEGLALTPSEPPKGYRPWREPFNNPMKKNATQSS